jgi:hypothetical protein
VKGVVLLALALLLAGCGSEATVNTQASTTTATVTTTTILPTPTAAVRATTTTIAVVPAWVKASPDFGVPGEPLEICGVVYGPDRVTVVASDPTTGRIWPDPTGSSAVVHHDGQWCWAGEFPGEMQGETGELYPVVPGRYDIDVYYEGTVILRTALEISSADLIASMPPSQSPEDARRDGVIPEIAALPFPRRVVARVEVAADEGDWVLSGLSPTVIESTLDDGCRLGDPLGTYPMDIVCSTEYGELLLINDGSIVNAYPMPGAPPSWIFIAEDSVYSGHIGDGGLPDSTLVRIDRETLEATVVLIPSSIDGGSEWLPTWRVAPESFSPAFWDAIHINSGKAGTPVESWIGVFHVDLAAIDDLIDTVMTTTFVWPPGTVTCAEIEDDFPVGVDDHSFSPEQGLVSYWRSGEEEFIQFVDDPTCTAGSAAWDHLMQPILDPDTLHRYGELCDFYAKVMESDPSPGNAATVLDHLAEAEELCP